MIKIVLDASAMLAVLNLETGSEKLTPEMLNVAAEHGQFGRSPNETGESRGRSR